MKIMQSNGAHVAWLAVVVVACLVCHAAALDNGLALTPPRGWNTWCTDDYCGLLDYCDEALIKKMADAMHSNGMQELGYQYVNMDDCWSATTRDANGQLQPDPTNFPNGMKALADYVHSKNLSIGIYLCAGTETCKRGRPGSWGHFDDDAKRMAEWGIDFVKLDWCHHPALPPKQVYSMFSESLNKTGKPILFSTCDWGEGEPAQNNWREIANMYRVHPDHLPIWESPSGTADIIQKMAGLSKFEGPGGWNDPDFLMTGLFPFTFNESKTEFAMWALFGGPLIVATDISDLDNEPQKKEILMNKEILAVNTDTHQGGDLAQNFTDGGQVWAKPLSDGSVAVVLYNSQVHIAEPPIDIRVDFGAVGLNNTRVHVRDLWAHQDVGIFNTGFTSSGIPPHASSMYLLTRE